MRLSKLQKYVLKECVASRNHVKPKTFQRFYDRQKERPSTHVQQDVITKSLERLIDKELMVGYGRRTPHKWFIDSVKLTAKGNVEGRRLRALKQQKLPLK